MAEAVVVIASAVKLGVFVALLIYSFLINAVSRHKSYGISIFTIAFVVAVAAEFFQVVGGSGVMEVGFESKTDLILNALTLIGGLGLIIFLSHVNKNIKDYK